MAAAAAAVSTVVNNSRDPGSQNGHGDQQPQGLGQERGPDIGNSLVSQGTESLPPLPQPSGVPQPQINDSSINITKQEPPSNPSTTSATGTGTTLTTSSSITVSTTSESLTSDILQSNNGTTNGPTTYRGDARKRKRQDDADGEHDADAMDMCTDGEGDEDDDKDEDVSSKQRQLEGGREACARTKGDIDKANKMWKSFFPPLSSSSDSTQSKVKWSPPTTHKYDPDEQITGDQ